MKKIKDRYGFIAERCRGKTVLDLGAVGENYKVHSERTPWLHLYLKDTAKELLGLDLCPSEILQEAEKMSGTRIMSGNVTDFDLRRQFDVVVAGELIEHLDDFRGFFSCVKKHLRSDSLFILSTPNCFAFDNLFNALLFGKTKHHPGHIVYFDQGTLGELLQRHGFEVVEWFYGTEKELSKYKVGLIRFLGGFRPIFNKDITAVCRLKQ